MVDEKEDNVWTPLLSLNAYGKQARQSDCHKQDQLNGNAGATIGFVDYLHQALPFAEK
ncbi:MAG: hypothetical protein ACI87E_002873 [Mariniblastus sp.]